MTHATLTRAPAPTAAAVMPARDPATTTGDSLSRRFGATLKQGLLHPLYLPVLGYRSTHVTG